MNFAASFCRRVSIKDLTTSIPVYNSASDASGGELSLLFRRCATKKVAGSTKNGRDSKPKNLGVKKFGGEETSLFYSGALGSTPRNFVGMGKDHTLFAMKEGLVQFEKHKLSGRKHLVRPHASPCVRGGCCSTRAEDSYLKQPRIRNWMVELSAQFHISPLFTMIIAEVAGFKNL
ncbi:hypothetical protein ACJRO7_019878 [Eucalyptus globulus]|uniref:Uncharacterized protein n=1 Tax=Eucalyptus globulus TaxID=34317 RepID=A0ABD3KLF8_EUCGL